MQSHRICVIGGSSAPSLLTPLFELQVCCLPFTRVGGCSMNTMNVYAQLRDKSGDMYQLEWNNMYTSVSAMG